MLQLCGQWLVESLDAVAIKPVSCKKDAIDEIEPPVIGVKGKRLAKKPRILAFDEIEEFC